jgi:hypothetical protein
MFPKVNNSDIQAVSPGQQTAGPFDTWSVN